MREHELETEAIAAAGVENRPMDGGDPPNDPAGNMTKDGNCGLPGCHTYTWDGENRLTRVDTSTTLSFLYNALGQQVQ